MSPVTVNCPKCRNGCEFQDGRIFGFCNKCGSKLEIDMKGEAHVYDVAQEKDEDVLFVLERYGACSGMSLSGREDADTETMNCEIERMMDRIMTFSEVLKDISASLDSMNEGKRLRLCEICFDLSDRLFMEFEGFLREYSDFGMYEELKGVKEAFSKKHRILSADFAATQKASAEAYWANRSEEHARLKAALDDAMGRKTKIPFYDHKRKRELDNEIAEIQSKLNRTH